MTRMKYFNYLASKYKLNRFETVLFCSGLYNKFKNMSDDYIELWAKRIKENTAWQYADTDTRKLMIDAAIYFINEEEVSPLLSTMLENLLSVK